MDTLGLYIHVPFCRSKCAYCDFYSLPGQDKERMEAHTEALRIHLERTAPRAVGYVVDTVYFGGGTPTVLGERRLLSIWEAVVRWYRLAPDAEVTIEANPESAGDWLRSLREAGFGRASLGMQSADDAELRRIGRPHSSAQVREAVETIRRAGFRDLSLDLIYGLPGQDLASWRRSVEAAVDLGPGHLSCYGLKVEEGTLLWSRREGLPGDEEQAEMYLWAVEELDRRGYGQYEISNFARPGHASRHNGRYWTLGAYLGFGPGAHSDFDGVRWAWSRDLEGYIRGVRDGDPPLSERTAVPEEERAREWLMLGLRTSRGLDPAVWEARWGRSFDPFRPFLDRCVRVGYGHWTDGRFALSPRGFLVSNAVIGEMLDLCGPT